jgi:hypothetical protein
VCAITSTTNWITTDPGKEIQCTNFSISGGVTLTVPSGTVIHATGTVTIAGTLTVGNSPFGFGWAQTLPNFSNGAFAQSPFALRKLLHPGSLGGGSGINIVLFANGAPPNAGNGSGGSGGGSLVIAAAGAVSITGTINANGEVGSGDGTEFADGGGGGGIVIIASKTSVSNSGTINAQGGQGTAAVSGAYCASGGGGGGVVHLLGPSITAGTLGTNVVLTGGPAGTGNVAVSGCNGGGAMGGNGGAPAPASGGSASAGAIGLLINSIVTDPSTLFVP